METNRNRLLSSLQVSDSDLLTRHFKRVPLDHGAVLQEREAPVEWVYFPLSGAVSLLAVMQAGGRDRGRRARRGRRLFADFGSWRADIRAVVQAPGVAECIALPQFRTIVSQRAPIHRLMFRYKETLSGQSQHTAACKRAAFGRAADGAMAPPDSRSA